MYPFFHVKEIFLTYTVGVGIQFAKSWVYAKSSLILLIKFTSHFPSNIRFSKASILFADRFVDLILNDPSVSIIENLWIPRNLKTRVEILPTMIKVYYLFQISRECSPLNTFLNTNQI